MKLSVNMKATLLILAIGASAVIQFALIALVDYLFGRIGVLIFVGAVSVFCLWLYIRLCLKEG